MNFVLLDEIDRVARGVLVTVKATEGHMFGEMAPKEAQGFIDTVGQGILANFAQTLPGGQQLVDALLKELDAAKQ